jgi:PhnB protein
MILPIFSVKDVAQSIAFYEKLGFTKDMAFPGPDGALSFAFVKLGTGTDTVIGLSRGSDVPATPYVDFMIYTAEGLQIEAYYQKVKDQGIPIAEEIKTQYWGDRTFTVVDPDGYRIVLSQTVHQADPNKMAAIMRGDEKAE